MKPFRLSLFVLLLFYHAIFLGVAIGEEWDWIMNNPQTVQIITLAGVVLFIIIFMLALYDRRHYQKKIARLEAEKDNIKAKVYDMQRRNDEIEENMKAFESSLEKKNKDKNKE
jgi:type VI protein secretion system component VasK